MKYNSWEDALHVGSTRIKVPNDVIKTLSTLNPSITIRWIVFDWLFILATALFCHYFFHPALYIITVLLIGGRISGLGVLQHEAVHFRLHPNRKLNDWISDLFAAWPLGFSTDSYRAIRHFPHHRSIGLKDDPHRWQTYENNDDWVFPKKKTRLIIQLIKVMLLGPIDFAISFSRSLTYSPKKYPSKLSYTIRILYYSLLLGCCIAFPQFGWGVVIYWLIPLLLWYPVLKEWRLMAEHFGISKEADLHGDGTRTTVIGWFGKTFLVPHNLNYHVEHHQYPSVPFFNLPKLHDIMLDNSEGDGFHITYGYDRVFSELTATTSN